MERAIVRGGTPLCVGFSSVVGSVLRGLRVVGLPKGRSGPSRAQPTETPVSKFGPADRPGTQHPNTESWNVEYIKERIIVSLVFLFHFFGFILALKNVFHRSRANVLSFYC